MTPEQVAMAVARHKAQQLAAFANEMQSAEQPLDEAADRANRIRQMQMMLMNQLRQSNLRQQGLTLQEQRMLMQ